MKVITHAFAIITCAVLAWIVAGVWTLLRPTTIPNYVQGSAFDYDPDSGRIIYIWLGVFGLLCFFWFLWFLKTKHD
jgi:hypothetical protein